MAAEDAQVEVERRLRDIGARLASLPGPNKELLSLIEEAEIWLSRVDQSPPTSMHNALKPTMDALVTKHLLNHTSQGIKVAVACCLTEVTRITAPEPPYLDEVMRDVFTVVVQSFAKLDETESPLFAKRVSMLETIAKVRSCVLMLDLDCDDLILNAFNHFFSTISSAHQENVINSMETIMMYVIQESEPVHSDLASCLLRYLKKEKKVSLPASFMLAERIVGLCREKLKPAFIELLQGTPLNDYSEAVASLVEGSSDAGRDDEVDAAEEDTVAGNKLSPVAVSDESPQESSRLEKGVDSPGQDGSPPYSTPAASLSSGGASVDNVKPQNGPASSKQKHEMPSDVKQTEVSDEVISDDKEAPEPVTTEPEKRSGVSSKKSRKLGTSTESKVTERSKVVSDNEGLVASGELSPETKVGNNKRTLETCNRAADHTSKTVDSTPAVDKPKRGRPPAVKSQEKKPVGKNQGSGLESKEVRSGSTSGGRPARRLTKDIKISPRKTGEEEFSKKQPKGSSNLRKEDTLSDEDTDEDLNLKEMVSPKSLTKTGKTKGQSGDSGVSKRKRVQEVEEVPQSKKNKVFDESLVGSRIKVWWPDDKKFYNGVVESFDDFSEKHKVVYDDGDVEQLQLTDEKWEFIAKGQDMNPNATSDMPRGRRGKGNWGQQTKEGRTETPKSSKQDSIEDSDLPKKRGRPKGVRSSMSNDDSPVASARSKAKNAEKDAEETPKAGSNLKTEGGRWPRSSGKAGNKDEAGSKHKGSNGLSTKRKPKEKEVESSEEEEPEPEPESAKASTGKKRRRKFA
ncbi:hypothetical protein ACQ4PT_047335 [Festuca glaucescens]